MVEEEKNIAEMYDALTVKTFVFFGSYLLKIKFFKIFFKAYLNAHPWGVGDINVFYNTIGKIVSKN
jgi:hypothetical protein